MIKNYLVRAFIILSYSSMDAEIFFTGEIIFDSIRSVVISFVHFLFDQLDENLVPFVVNAK